MSIEEVRQTLYDTVSDFFVGATVIWAEQVITIPSFPYVTLKIGPLQRNAFPIFKDDFTRYYLCSVTAEINLYTQGKKIETKGNALANYANTAISDMTDFFNYLESEIITDMLAGKGIDISLIPPVRDLSELLNDSRYRYRAMAEATISFALEADGMYGISGMAAAPNSSGGGTQEMVDIDYVPIEEAEIIEGGIDLDEE